MSKKDKGYLISIIKAIEKIEKYVSVFNNADEFYKNELNFDATMMNFIVISEMITKLSDDFIQEYKHIEWAKIKSFRNIIAHDYFGVDAEEVWQIINTHLVKFKDLIKQILQDII